MFTEFGIASNSNLHCQPKVNTSLSSSVKTSTFGSQRHGKVIFWISYTDFLLPFLFFFWGKGEGSPSYRLRHCLRNRRLGESNLAKGWIGCLTDRIQSNLI
ncbi:unnamed protein product [Musa acuminata subsp. malaccensis]|uniref:(wild Malaysian banana) hypothetical protein n=1 Tax=Musa acuminata subsp. malaccensis TaxID=214687 RepID=A0A804I8A3_MUSAM|nr:unnamed protein product [Musa acuminata subsp. malaccensis]